MENPLTSIAETHSRLATHRTDSSRASIDWESIAKLRLDELTKPPASLGRLEDLASKMVCIQREPRPHCSSKLVYVFAADHGVTDEGVSAYPKQVTRQMVCNFLAGGAAINILARHAKAEVIVVDVGVDADFEPFHGLVQRKIRRGTRNMALGPAMTMDEVNSALNVGRCLIQELPPCGKPLIAVGEMGIGNTTAAAAITAAVSGQPSVAVTGMGTGISSGTLAYKRRVIDKALSVNAPKSDDAIDVLRKVGGLEIAAMTGMLLEALEHRIPMVIDGFISTAAAALAYLLQPRVKDILFAGHISREPGHRVLLEYIGLEPILDLGMRLGEGTGAVLAMTVIEAAVRIFNEMATMSSAGVSGPMS